MAMPDFAHCRYYAMLTVGGAPSTSTWKHSDKCIGCKDSSSEQCCYDPAQGPSSYTCFAVSNCSQVCVVWPYCMILF